MATDDRISCVVGFEGSWDHGWGFNDLMENPSFWGSGRPLWSRPAPQNDRFSIKSLNPHLLNPHRASADLKARWTEDSKDRKLKFSFLKEWVASDACSWLTECSLSIFVWLHF